MEWLKECFYCGRKGKRGYWVQIRLHPEPNRVICSDSIACRRRQTKQGRAPRG